MPPLSRIQTDALAALAEELRFAPREALLRDIQRAEALATEIDPTLTYPIDWIVFRMTGYRPELPHTPPIEAAALTGDLSAFVEKLCHAAKLTEADFPDHPIWADDLAARWNTSRKTLDRWRRRGLIGRRVYDSLGNTRLCFMAEVAEAFASQHPDLIKRAKTYSRLDAQTKTRILSWAQRYQRRLAYTLNQSAARIAPRVGRSHETIRQLLLKHDARCVALGQDPIFPSKRPIDAADRRAAFCAWEQGIEPDTLAKQLRRTRSNIHQIINQCRLDRLAKLGRRVIPAGALELDDAALEDILKSWQAYPAGPKRWMPAVPDIPDLVDLLEWMQQPHAPDPDRERLAAMAQSGLLARAAQAIARASDGPIHAADLDRAETDFRHAAWIRLSLGPSQFRLVLETAIAAIGTSPAHMRQQDALATIRTCLDAISEGLDRFDPWKGGRLAAPVGMAAARLTATLVKEVRTFPSHHAGAAPSPSGQPSRRAQMQLSRGTPSPDLFESLSPWIVAIGPSRTLRDAHALLPKAQARILALRFGLGIEQPHTLEELAALENTTIMHAGRMLRRAIRAAAKSPPV